MINAAETPKVATALTSTLTPICARTSAIGLAASIAFSYARAANLLTPTRKVLSGAARRVRSCPQRMTSATQKPAAMALFAAFVIAVLALAATSAPANAARGCEGGETAPPGNSEVDQYFETVPNGCSDGPVNPPASGIDGSQASGGSPVTKAVSPKTAAQLDDLGRDGRAALELARSGAPDRLGSTRFSGHVAGSDNGGGVGNLFATMLGAADGSGSGIGWLLPLLLILIALGGGAYLLARSNSQPS